MSEINYGGSAFPGEQGEDKNGKWNQTWDPGMTIRDYFTAAALTGLLSNTGVSQPHKGAAEFAIRAADAVLKAREGK